jgi:ubiquinone/menaquinone biosynthesis C-methylase UbiE
MSAKTNPSELTISVVERMNYSQLIGVVRETARPPGGFRTVQRLAEVAGLSATSRVLEVGTSTGFGALELTWLTGCHIDAIDIDANCLEEGRRRATRRGLQDRIDFQLDDAMNLSFADSSFDLLFCGNMTSLLPDKNRAFAEYVRVLRPGGVLAATPMYYVDEIAPAELIKRVSVAQGADFVPMRRAEALDLYHRPHLDPLFAEDYAFDRQTDDRLVRFVDGLVAQPHLVKMNADVKGVLAARYLDMMKAFRDNLAYMGFTLALWRKDSQPVDGELFTATRVR